MIFLKLWFVLCFSFFLYNISLLVEDSRSVKYLESEQNEDHKGRVSFSFCIELEDRVLKPKFQSSKNEYNFTVLELLEYACSQYFSTENCQSSIFLNRSYIFNYNLCFVFAVGQFDSLIKNASVNPFRLFIFFLERSEIFFCFNLKLSVDKSKPFQLNLNTKEVHLLGNDYQTDCHTYSNANTKLKTSEIVYSQPSCLYECLKSKTSRSLSYYYSTKDTERLIVQQKDLNRSRTISWKTSDRHLNKTIEAQCKKLCEKISCIITTYSFQIIGDNQTTFSINLKHELSPGVPFFTRFTFIFDALSLVALFFNISLFVTVPSFAFRLIKKLVFLYLKIYGRYLPVAYLRKSYWTLKISTFILGLSLLIGFSAYRIVKYAENEYSVLKSSSFPTEISPFYLVLCVPVQMFVSNSEKLNVQTENQLLTTKSFVELENLTNFDQNRHGKIQIYVKYATARKDVEYSMNVSKVLFRNYKYNEGNFLTRCYEIRFDTNALDERRYDVLFSLSKLRLKAEFNWFVVIPLVANRQLGFQSQGLFLKRDFSKFTATMKSNCTNYEQTNENCSSQGRCIDWCVLNSFRKKHSNLTTFTVVEKSKLSQIDLAELYFNNTLDQSIVDECRKNVSTRNCYTEYFLIKDNKPVNLNKQKFFMHLYYSDFIIYEDPYLTLRDLLLNNFLNFLSIFLGLNMGKLFALLFAFLKLKFCISNLYIIFKLYKYFKLLVCLLGFAVHCYILLNNALYGDLIYIEEFSRLKTVQIPNLIFCFKFNETEIDPNKKLTYSYLDELTQGLDFGFFQKLSFLDENYDYQSVDYRRLIKNDSLDALDGISRFYFIDNLKCFEFRFLRIKNDRYLFLLKDMIFAKIQFNREAISKFYNSRNKEKSKNKFSFHFISKQPNTYELNGIDRLTMELKSKNDSKKRISIGSNLVVFKQRNFFAYVRHPLSLLFKTVNLNDTTNYVEELTNGLQRLNLKTKRIPMFRDSDQLEIDDQLADQYYLQVKNLSDFGSPRVINFEREFYFSTSVEEETNLDDYDLYFYLNPAYVTTTMTNRENHSKVVINTLNCLSFWFNFCVLDIHMYVQKFFGLFLKLYERLLVFKGKLSSCCELNQFLNPI